MRRYLIKLTYYWEPPGWVEHVAYFYADNSPHNNNHWNSKVHDLDYNPPGTPIWYRVGEPNGSYGDHLECKRMFVVNIEVFQINLEE